MTADARNVQQDTSTPRLVYRGKEDVLGLGMHTDPETGELVGENKAVNSQEELEQAQKDGWRLTAADPNAEAEPQPTPLRAARSAAPSTPAKDKK